MKDLKFRVWSFEQKRWVEKQSSVIKFSCELNEIFETEKYEFQQYTGLKDKNGKAIYEGDILNWESNSMSHRLGECKRTRIVEVKWDQEKAAFITCEIGRKGLIPTWKMDANDFNGKPFIKEVIGNIFENKDLLN